MINDRDGSDYLNNVIGVFALNIGVAVIEKHNANILALLVFIILFIHLATVRYKDKKKSLTLFKSIKKLIFDCPIYLGSMLFLLLIINDII